MPVPVFNALIQADVEIDLLQDMNRDKPGNYCTGLLYPTHGEPTLVEVPARLGVHSVRSPYDLDATVWIGLGNGPSASSFDADSCAMTVHRWPADEIQPLDHSYTIFCASQGSEKYGGGNHEQPFNDCVNKLTAAAARLWRGNLVVLRSSAHSGTKSRYDMGISDMSERDIYLVDAIIRGCATTRLTVSSLTRWQTHPRRPIRQEHCVIFLLLDKSRQFCVDSNTMAPVSPLPPSVLDTILASLPWPALMACAQTNHLFRQYAKRIFQRRLSRRLAYVLLGRVTTSSQRQATASAFLRLLETTDGVVTGSLPLALLTFTEESDDENEIDNINVLVPMHFTNEWFQFIIAGLGFNW
uniref:F-box domain-containing protein n=1 Tax=Mycena chlorophos TaxID=658473 RepID=A0ABQ0KZH1_MYCCL|nr:predicted protein [Mycena chlorophos]